MFHGFWFLDWRASISANAFVGQDAAVRRKMYKAEETLGRVLPDDLRQERLAKLKSDTTLLER